MPVCAANTELGCLHASTRCLHFPGGVLLVGTNKHALHEQTTIVCKKTVFSIARTAKMASRTLSRRGVAASVLASVLAVAGMVAIASNNPDVVELEQVQAHCKHFFFV